MYEQFFGLTEKPFSIQPDPAFLYWGRTHRLAYAMLEYGVLNHAGISVITGEVGCGKTTLIHRLLDQLSDTHSVALISNIQEGRGDLLSWVLMGFGEPFAGKSHVELFSQLQNFFISEYAKGRRVVLIIDEAQNLSTDMLEELRLLSNINAGKDQLLQLILVGQPQLKGLLNKPELLQLAQRVGSDFHLTPLNKEEVRAYIDTRLAIAGCRRRVFTDRATDLIAEQSRGVPRVINIIADTALVYAFSAEELVVGVETIRNVIRDKTEFGVFGLASDESAAPPLRPADDDDGGIDAFATGGAQPREAPKRKSQRKSAAEVMEEFDEPEEPDLVEDEPDVVEPPREAIPVADMKTQVTTQTAAQVAARAEEQFQSTRPAVREESSITGVVIVSTNPRVSPEAAIRSAGDGRAIVFVAVGASPEAISIARKAGAVIVEGGERALGTGGRARNAGYRQLKKIAPHVKYVQFLDAECALDPDWISRAERFMARRPEVSVVEGFFKTSEDANLRQPTLRAQKLADADGEIQTVLTGSALMRADAFEAIGGYRGDLVTAETEDLCVRLRRRGSRIWREEAIMAIARPAPSSRESWWKTSFRRGFDNAFCASLHGGAPDRLGVLDTVLAVFWAAVFPVVILIASIVSLIIADKFLPLSTPWLVALTTLLAGAGIYFLRIFASVVWRGIFRKASWGEGYVAVMGQFPELLGAMRFWFRDGR